VTSINELNNLRSCGIKIPIAIIPIGIDTDLYKPSIKNEKNKTFLFLSRIHQKKGIEFLIHVWKCIPANIKEGWKIEICGDGDETYVNKLKYIVFKNNLFNEITFIGPKYNHDKIKKLQESKYLILPSYSENYGIVVAEALSSGIPVITTNLTPWSVLNDTKSGWCLDLDLNSFTNTLIFIMNHDTLFYESFSINARQLAISNFSKLKMKQDFIKLYNWILYKSQKPDFIYYKDK
jgi:glycosyltransferase involved in cell wall biosynthesis